MNSLLIRIGRFLIFKVIGQQSIVKLIRFLSWLACLDLLSLAYQSIGILNYEDSGELFVINVVLKEYIKKNQPVFFDVGANVGEYSKELRKAFSNAEIYAFEPNCNTFEVLNKNLAGSDVKLFNLGIGSQAENKVIYTYEKDQTSGHASIYKDVLLTVHKAKEIKEVQFNMTTLDGFCQEKGIEYIDLLKIDAEGHELEIMNGARQMITQGKIGIIQFEFNETHIISRVFLKDFYEFLSDYSIYRLDAEKLIPLGEYSYVNEIFRFQNLLAVKKELLEKI